jgi:Ring finger domain
MARLQTKAYLYKKQFSYFGQFSPPEELVSDQFGSTVQRLMKNSLKEWAAAMKPIVTATAPYKSLNERDAVILIMDHLRDYHYSYEQVYGYMEETTVFGKIQGSTVYIQSTGYGVKVLLGLMMADRLHVIERWRREERERVCFERVDSSDLPADCKNCSVCQDPLDTETPEGASEQGLKLIICCQQVIGESCLKAWLAQSGPSIRKNCPNCRFDFPQCFLVKLFGEGYQMEVGPEEEEYDEEDTIVVEHPREVVDLVSPSPQQPPGPEETRHERSPAPSPAFGVSDLIPGVEIMPRVEVTVVVWI